VHADAPGDCDGEGSETAGAVSATVRRGRKAPVKGPGGNGETKTRIFGKDTPCLDISYHLRVRRGSLEAHFTLFGHLEIRSRIHLSSLFLLRPLLDHQRVDLVTGEIEF
jgi:hypothetical protein